MPQIAKVLIANRGEIAVRVIRAARDAGNPRSPSTPTRIATPCTRASPTRPTRSTAPPAPTPTSSVEKILSIARRSGADAVHPGYGFLAENAGFRPCGHRRRADLDRPVARGHRGARRQGHRPPHRREGGRAAGPGHARTRLPAPEVVAFADEHGLPIAIKAAFGGGGRGLKVARTLRRRSPSCSSPRPARRSPPSAAANASSRSTSTSRATSRPSASRMPQATSSWSRPGTARCSAGTRSSSKRRPRRS